MENFILLHCQCTVITSYSIHYTKLYDEVLEAVERVPGVKRVFIRSGLRFDYIMADKDGRFFERLVKKHVSGQLKVAPEHVCPDVV